MWPTLESQNKDILPSGDIITITERTEDGTTVGYEISQEFTDSPVTLLVVEFEGEQGPKCAEFHDVAPGPLPSPFTSKCDKDWMATVTLYAYDVDSFPDVPPYTQTTSCMIPTTGNVIVSTYKVPCPVACIKSMEPTSPPTECIPTMDMTQEGDFGDYNPTEEILKILQQSSDGKSVMVQVRATYHTHTWKSSLLSLY